MRGFLKTVMSRFGFLMSTFLAVAAITLFTAAIPDHGKEAQAAATGAKPSTPRGTAASATNNDPLAAKRAAAATRARTQRDAAVKRRTQARQYIRDLAQKQEEAATPAGQGGSK